MLKPDAFNLTLAGYAAPEGRGRVEGLFEVADVLLQGVCVVAQGLLVQALLEDREPVPSRSQVAVGRDGVGGAPF